MSTDTTQSFDATLQHAQEWIGQSIAGWHWSEKLDGVRARWDGAQLLTRSGAPIDAPARLTERLPAYPLDIEVYAGSGRYETARQAVQLGRWPAEVELVIFDAPTLPGDYLQRIRQASRSGCKTVPHGTLSLDADKALATVTSSLVLLHRAGGEGYMLAQPGAAYAQGRTGTLLKFKHESIYERAAA